MEVKRGAFASAPIETPAGLIQHAQQNTGICLTCDAHLMLIRNAYGLAA